MCRAARPIVWISERSERRKPFLVGVEDRDQRDLRDVEPFAQQVDADQHVELAQPQVADDLHALDRLDVGVQVAHLDAVLGEVLGQVLGHALGERRDQHALAALDALVDLREQIVDLGRRRAALRRAGRRARSGAPPAPPPAPGARARIPPASPRRRPCGASCASNSSKRSGRLSSADGRRKP